MFQVLRDRFLAQAPSAVNQLPQKTNGRRNHLQEPEIRTIIKMASAPRNHRALTWRVRL
jgi:hypothetical protein